MMKHNILAIVIPALMAGTSTVNATEIYNKDGNRLDLYTKFNIRHFFGEKNSNDDSRFHLGIKGYTQISDQITGFNHFEWKTPTNRSEDAHKNINHLAYAGFKIANFGSLDYGRNYGVLYDINAWTDVLPLYGGNTMAQTDNYMTGINRYLLTYRITDFFGMVDGLNVAIQYQGKNKESNKTTSKNYSKNNGAGFGVAAKYDIGWGISLGASYSKSNNDITNTDKTNTDKDKNNTNVNNVEGWNTGIKYDVNNIYLAAMYGKTSNLTRFGDIITETNMTKIANKTENFEMVSQYLFDEIGLKPSIAYVQSKGKNLSDPDHSKDQDLVKYVSLGAFYYFNQNLTAVIDYKINLIDGNNQFADKYGIRKDNMIGLGLAYKF